MFIFQAILDQITLQNLVLYCPLDTTNLFVTNFTTVYSQSTANYCPLDTTANNFYPTYTPTYTESTANYCPLDTTIFS